MDFTLIEEKKVRAINEKDRILEQGLNQKRQEEKRRKEMEIEDKGFFHFHPV